ncbi:MAG: 4Fe-4S binding protein [Lentisphaeria bacterium]|nr:4Fe-4S binding protein [Lentisphaeria bacterium]
MLTSEIIKAKAVEFGADLVGIGDVRLFAGTMPQRDPLMILPKAKSIIGCAFRVPRALYRAMADRTQFFNYTQLGVKYIDEEFAEIFLLKMGALIEDGGYDACLQRNVSNLRIKGDHTTNPELVDTYELVYASPVEPDKPAPEVILDFAQAARICGLGAAGASGSILVPKFGPFVRFVFIVTDAALDTGAPFGETLCDNCGACAGACPGNAVTMGKGTDSWQCAVYYRGAHRSNPFMTEEFLKGDPERDAILDGRKRFTRETARALYPKLDFLPSRTGYAPCLCGKRCDVACFNHLKEKNLI